MTQRLSPKLRAPAAVERYLTLVYPSVMLALLFLIPLCLMLAVSVANRSASGFYQLGFNLSHYLRVTTSPFFRQTLFSLFLAGIAAVGCVSLAFPFTYLLTQLSRRSQQLILIFILAVLSLSEVVVSFSWSVLLSQTAGFSNILVWLGFLPHAVAWSPGFSAVLVAFVYRAFPFAVLVFYPSLSRLNPEMTEASRTLGASPLQTFFNVILPIQRPAIVTAFLLVFIFALGSYLIPQMLGKPEHWTISVLITDQAIHQSNLPFATALALILTGLSLLMVWLISSVSPKQEG